MKNLLTIIMFCALLPCISQAQNIVSAEYFFDTDPGYGGSGTHSIDVTPGVTVALSFSVAVTGLAPGYHWMFVRTKDAIGNISFYEPQQFYITSDIIAAEYFFDTDPGYGATGTHSISVSPGTAINLSFSADLTGLTPGFHWMFVRTKDVNGLISLSEPQQFYITNYITAAEYFFDTDNGVGTGTPIAIVTPAETVSINNYAISPDIPDPITQDYTHSLFIRTQDATGKWSLSEPQNLYECGTSVSIVQGSSITVCNGTPATLNAVVNTSDYNIQFNGSTTYIKVPDANALHPIDFTIEAYLNATSFANNRGLIGKGITGGGNCSYLMYLDATSKLHCKINNTDFIATGITLSANTWYHAAFVKSGTGLSVYVNGELKATATGPVTPAYDGSAFFIGAYDSNNDGNADNFFNGKMDEVRIWNYARTQSQISANMNTIINPAADGLVGYWRMDDGSGTSVKDRSVAHNNGTTFNSPTWVSNPSPIPIQHVFNYAWLPITGLSVSNTAAVTASLTTTTTYTVTATEAATNCSATASIIANVLTPVALSNSPGASPICAGNTLNLFCTGVDPSLTTFSWTGPNGFTSSLQNPVIANVAPANAGVYTVTATDVSGCSVTTPTMVVINYVAITSCPSVPPANNTSGECGTNVYFSSNIAAGIPMPLVTFSQNPGTFFDVGTTPVIATATNTCGSVACTFDVTVNDIELPLIQVNPPLSSYFNDPGSCGAIVSWSPPTTTDNCPGPIIITSNYSPGDLFPVGLTLVTYTLTDSHGNTTSSIPAFSIMVTDTQKPSIIPPPDITVNTIPGSCNAAIYDFGTPQTADNCGIQNVTHDAPPNVPGTWPITWTVIDIHGHTSTAIQHVIIVDNELPVITCLPLPSFYAAPGLCSLSMLLNAPQVQDNCGVMNIISNAPSSFDVGITDVTWIATDIHGNSTSCTQHINVVDDQNPTITCPPDITVNPDPGQFYASNVSLGTPTTMDNCGVNSVTNNAPATFPLGTTTPVQWLVTDIHGNHAACTQHVTVTNNQLPTIICPTDVTVNTDAGLCTASGVALGIPVASGDGINAPTNNAPSIFPVGTTDVLWTVTDVYGNSASCIQHVIVFPNAEVCNGMDDNCNGQIDEGNVCNDADGDGYTVAQGDCDDENAAIYPTATEICNAIDDNCNGNSDEGCGNIVQTDASWIYSNSYDDNWFQPDFNDLNWNPAIEIEQGFPDDPNLKAIWGSHPNPLFDIVYLRKSFFIAEIPNCAYLNYLVDDDAEVYVNGVIVSNDYNSLAGPEIDNVDIAAYLIANANNVIAVKAADRHCCHYSFALRVRSRLLKVFIDADGDTYGNSSFPLTLTTPTCTVPPGYTIYSADCNDGNADIHPNAIEVCNGVDDNCSGSIDEGLRTRFYADSDGDGYGNHSIRVIACAAPSGYVTDRTDCNDGNAAIHPDASDICNGIDDNCDGMIDENAITATVTPAGSVTICDGSSIMLSANSGTGITYQWLKGAKNISGATNQTYTANKAAGYKVKESNSFGCSSTSASTTVNVNPSPTAAITYSTLDLCGHSSITLTANSGGGYTYRWLKGTSYISEATNQTYSATTKATYKVVVTNASGCSKTSAGVKVIKSCRESSGTSPQCCVQLDIYPNPNNGHFMIDLQTESDAINATLEIFNEIGQRIYQQVLPVSEGGIHQEVQLPLNTNAGIYFVKVAMNDKVYTGQISYQK